MFADEAGDFAFMRNGRASRYFILCTMTVPNCDLGAKLLRLRKQLVWEGLPVGDCLHATEDKQAVRDRVFELLRDEDLTIEATILEKSKAQRQIRPTEHRFYQHAWYFHFYGAHRKILGDAREMLVTAASLGTKKGRAGFEAGIQDVMRQFYGIRIDWKTDHCPAMADPCLQAVDYCTWAMQRKWERDDARAYDLISHKVRHEYETWRHGTVHHY
ncbi:DUF3800 domain-containing protein [Lysobacter soli]|uniref:DUF3800 domain-containing protein n=1 Tax=Lysobacter soli TaxID=453783 RepID=UPI0011C07C49|nr:DUF3800 domain-containing protein [Lysobacter soli]